MINTMQNKKQIREKVKQELLRHNYKQAINIAIQYADNQKIRGNLQNILNKYEISVEELKNKQIDAQAFYYKMNEIVRDTLNNVDEIVGEPDEDWDFIDQLTSSLKFNLIDPDDAHSDGNAVFAVRKKDGSVVFNFEIDETEKDENFKTLEKLYKQLNYYEKKEQEATDPIEKEKLQDIIKAINLRISQLNTSPNE